MRLQSRSCLGSGLIIFIIVAAGVTRAEEEPPFLLDTGSGTTIESLRRQRQIVADQIAETAKPNAAGQHAENVSEHHALEALDAVYAQHQIQIEQRAELESEVTAADQELASLDKFDLDEPKPYSFLLLERLNDQLAAEKDRQSAIKADTKSAKQLLQAAHEDLDASMRDQGARAKKVDGATSATQQSRESSTEPQLAVALARAKVALRETEIEVLNLRLRLSQTKHKQLTKKIETVKKDVKFSAQDRDKQFQRLAEIEADLKRQRQRAEAGLQQVESQKASDLSEISHQKDQKSPQRLVDAAVDAWRVAADAYQSEIVLLDQRIDRLGDIRRFWKHRYELASETVEPKKVAQWLEDAEEYQDQLGETSSALQHRLDTVRDDQATLAHDRLPETREWQDKKLARLQELRDLSAASLDEIKSTQRMLGRFVRELKARLRERPVSWTTSIGESFKSLFGHEVAEDDEAQSVTVGQLLALVVYVVAGAFMALVLSRLAGRYVFHYLGLHPGAAAALKSMMFYALCIVFGVVAFELLQVPMTAFAFVGGAVAIAVGFGGQDIMNNFMSGLILLAEQPIRVGDVVELNGVQGLVSHIGLRSTRLQTQANHELIVPNHSLLDSSVTNLTLSDNFVQTFVTIGVDRDVDVQKAKWQMLEIAFAHPLILKSPRPAVLMTEVDTYWITFQVHFWLQYTNYMQIAMIQSQVLEKVSDLFRPVPAQTASGDDVPEKPDTLPEDAIADMRKMGAAAVINQMKRMGRSVKLKS